MRRIWGRSKTAAKSEIATNTAGSSVSANFEIGIKQLYTPTKTPCVVDIVFLHGLHGHRERTWQARNASAPWPEILLPIVVPQARILTFGYDARVANMTAMVSKSRIGGHAKNLLNALATHRELDDSNDRPIIFVTHSLGGLVCEDALLASRDSAEGHLQRILECTRAIAFLGTPHQGSAFADWAVLLAKYLKIAMPVNLDIPSILRTDSEVLSRIQTSFHEMLRQRASTGKVSIAITCFYEELPLPGVGTVVNQQSAIIPAYIHIGIHANHMEMAQFAHQDDPGFISVAGELRRWVKNLNDNLGWFSESS